MGCHTTTKEVDVADAASSTRELIQNSKLPRWSKLYLLDKARPWTVQRYKRAFYTPPQQIERFGCSYASCALAGMDRDVAAFSNWLLMLVTAVSPIKAESRPFRTPTILFLPPELWHHILSFTFAESLAPVARGKSYVACDKIRWQQWIAQLELQEQSKEPRQLRKQEQKVASPPLLCVDPRPRWRPPWYTKYRRALHWAETQLVILEQQYRKNLDAAKATQRSQAQTIRRLQSELDEREAELRAMHADTRNLGKRKQDAVARFITAGKKKDAEAASLRKAAEKMKRKSAQLDTEKGRFKDARRRTNAVAKDTIAENSKLTGKLEASEKANGVLRIRLHGAERNKVRQGRQLQSEKEKVRLQKQKVAGAEEHVQLEQKKNLEAQKKLLTTSAKYRKRIQRQGKQMAAIAEERDAERAMRLEAQTQLRDMANEYKCKEDELYAALDEAKEMCGMQLTFLKEGEKKEYNEKFYTACRRFLRIGLSAKMIPKVMKAAAAMMNVEMDSVPSRGTVEKAQGQLAVLLCDQVATSLNENAATPGRFQATSMHSDGTSKANRGLMGVKIKEVSCNRNAVFTAHLTSSFPTLHKKKRIASTLQNGEHTYLGWWARLSC